LPGAENGQAYFEGRLYQMAGQLDLARQCFEAVVARDRTCYEPFLRLAETLRAAGDPERAAQILSEALPLGLSDDRDLWALWTEISVHDLNRTIQDLMATFPPGDFSTYRLRGTASWDREKVHLQLTDAVSAQAGRAFYKLPLPMEGWSADFEFRFEQAGGLGGGADGMTFAFVRDYSYIRDAGGRLDLGGRGYAVEFDPFAWRGDGIRDPIGDHIGILRGNTNQHLTTHRVSGGFQYNVWHTVRVVFEGGRISVVFDGQTVIADYEIPDFTPFTGYVGFTAATGSGYERHLVRNIRLKLGTAGN
jgi:hypothetical protein